MTGVQWVLSCCEVDPVTMKPTRVDMQFLDCNRRTIETMSPKIEQRMMQGGVMFTDCWSAYQQCAVNAGCEHRTVNHSKWFKDPITGIVLHPF